MSKRNRARSRKKTNVKNNPQKVAVSTQKVTDEAVEKEATKDKIVEKETAEKEVNKKEEVVVEQKEVTKKEDPVIEIPAPDLGPRRSVVFIGSECYPFVKTGGLGDVMSALPKSLAKLNVDVKVILP